MLDMDIEMKFWKWACMWRSEEGLNAHNEKDKQHCLSEKRKQKGACQRRGINKQALLIKSCGKRRFVWDNREEAPNLMWGLVRKALNSKWELNWNL